MYLNCNNSKDFQTRQCRLVYDCKIFILKSTFKYNYALKYVCRKAPLIFPDKLTNYYFALYCCTTRPYTVKCVVQQATPPEYQVCFDVLQPNQPTKFLLYNLPIHCPTIHTTRPSWPTSWTMYGPLNIYVLFITNKCCQH